MDEISDKKVLTNRLAGDIICCLVIVAVGLAIGLPRYLNGIDLGDEGALAYGAERVLQGQIPHRDFYCNHPPLSSYTAVAMFKLFGTSLASLRILGLCIYLLIPLLVYSLLRHLTKPLIALVAAIPAAIFGMPLYHFIPFASIHAITAMLAAMLFMMRAVFTGRRWWAFGAGLTTALVFVARQDYGGYLSIGILVYALALKFANRKGQGKFELGRILRFWVAGIVALMLPLMVYWFVVGAIPSMLEQLIIFPLFRYSDTSSIPMPVFRTQPLTQNLLVALFYLQPVVAVLTTLWLVVRLVRRRFCVSDASLVFFLVPSILFYYQVLVRSDIFHVAEAMIPLFIVCGWWLSVASAAAGAVIGKLCNCDQENRRVTFSATVVVVFLVVAIGGWFLSYTKPILLKTSGQTLREVSLERADIWLSPEYASVLEDMVKKIQMYAKPDRSVLCLPYHPMFYFLSQRYNPTQWDYLWPGDMTTEDYQKFIEQCQTDPPAVVLIIGREEMAACEKVVLDYVDSEYRLAYEGNGMMFYLPLKQLKSEAQK